MHFGKTLSLVFALGCLAFLTGSSAGQTTPELDEQILKSGGVPTDNDGLLKFFRLRSLKDGDRKVMEDFIKQLSSDVFRERENATKELILRGALSLPFLLAAKKDASLETQRRVEIIMKKIDSSSGPELPVSAARLLASRNTPGAIEALLNFLPYANDEWVEEEVLGSVGQLTIKGDKIDPLLSEALKDKFAERRAAAVYVLGRRGELDTRESVRAFLSDSEAIVRLRAAQSLAGKRAFQTYKDAAAADEAIVKGQKLETDEPSLLEFLRRRTLGPDDQKRLQKLVDELGDPAYAVRTKASKQLVKEGMPAIAFLKPALDDLLLERSQRAKRCIEEIRKGPGPALPIAVVRLLCRPASNKDHTPAAAIRVLLAYAPFADDETVEEEVLTALTLLNVRDSKIDPLIPDALTDTLPVRRAAAAHVLGRVGSKDQVVALRKTLEDPSPIVRYRAAQALLVAKDKEGVPPLIALLNDGPVGTLWQVEESLQRLAGDKAPTETVGDGAAEKRKAAVKAWDKWWQANNSTLDLAKLEEGGANLGLTLVCEYDSAIGQPGGQIWEAARDGKPRWKIQGVMGAMDAQVLPNGRILVAENSGNRVTERDLKGNIHWEYRTPGNPVCCQRLPNGNTFIAMYNNVMEVSHDQKTVLYNINKGPQFHIFSAHKMKNGHVVTMTAQGVIHVFDPIANKDIRTINTGQAGGWCSVEGLANGRFLIATMNNGQVREIDADNKSHWSVNLNGAFRATRLPNGNTLVASMNTRQVIEYDRAGAKRWEKTCDGRPWSVHYR